MSKPLSSIKDGQELKETIARRIKSNTGGLGYLSALDAEELRKRRDEAVKKRIGK